jgi:membrane protease YdiL (CAAX protease family)
MPDMRAAQTSHWEIIAIVAICFGYMILGSVGAAASGFPAARFSDSSLMSLVIVEIVLAMVAIAILKGRHYPLRVLLPRPTMAGTIHGVALGAFALLAGSLTMWVFSGHELSSYNELIGRPAISFLAVRLVSIVNGVYEEVFLLGYVQRELMPHGAAFALGAGLLVRLLYHTYQGPVGASGVLAFGLVCGLYVLRTGTLWPPVLAHILADIIGLSTIAG